MVVGAFQAVYQIALNAVPNGDDRDQILAMDFGCERISNPRLVNPEVTSLKCGTCGVFTLKNKAYVAF